MNNMLIIACACMGGVAVGNIYQSGGGGILLAAQLAEFKTYYYRL